MPGDLPPVTLDRIVLATGNPHKLRELREAFTPIGVEVVALPDLGRFEEPPESGDSFEANATIKALAYAELTGLPCLADDSGLEIEALAGRPGVISSHYCTNGIEAGMTRDARDAANNERVLHELRGVPEADRTARFVCVMVLAVPALGRLPAPPSTRPRSPLSSTPRAEPRALATVRGTFEGRIGIPPRVPAGTNGFGYDPLFLVGPDFTRTSAELAPEAKHALSHRGQAARLMAERIAQLRATPA